MTSSLLRRFAASTRLEPKEPLWETMRAIGTDIVDTVKTLRARLDYLEHHAEFWSLALPGKPAEVFFLPRTEPAVDEPSLGLEEFMKRRGKLGLVVAQAYPDRRSGGYALSRFRDAPDLDFTRIAKAPDVHFAHARGFVAKTSATDPVRLRELIEQAAKA